MVTFVLEIYFGFLECSDLYLFFVYVFFFNDPATTEIYTYYTLFPYTTLFRSTIRPARSTPMPTAPALSAAVRAIMNSACSPFRSEEHTSELQSLMRISYAVFCLKKKRQNEM